MSTAEWKWSLRHEKAIVALLEEDTVAAACRVSGTQRSTMQRWLKQPEFKARLERERAELFTALKARLFGATPEAVGTLQEAMRDTKATWNARVQAARSVLALSVRIRELELADKLDTLEETVDMAGEIVQ